MRSVRSFMVGLALCLVAGCAGLEPSGGEQGTVAPGSVLLSVDFQQGQTLRYKFVSSRDITLDWDPGQKDSTPDNRRVVKSSESLETVMTYTAIEVDPYGLSRIEAKIESITARRSKSRAGPTGGADAVQSLAGKTFVVTVDPAGRIQDYSQLDAAVRAAGEKAFRTDTSKGRVKDPDMIADFIASQWFLWDSIASIETPSAGVTQGQSWTSQLSVPTPMVMRLARDVTYTLKDVRAPQEGGERTAVIGSAYAKADSTSASWPIPYSGRFMMSGTFGFLGSYQVLSLNGQGEEVFNIERGRIEESTQSYELQLKAALPPMGVRANPHLTINQKLTAKLLGP